MGYSAKGAQQRLSVRFRPARADDADAAVPLIYSSGPVAFDYVFANPVDGDAQAFLRRCFVDGDGEFGWRNHWVGEAGKRVVAVGAGFGADSKWPFTLAAARQILGHYGAVRAAPVIVRGLRVESLIRPPEGDMHYLAHLAVSPELRGGGIGHALINALVYAGKAAGRRRMTLDVAATNPRAQALYERMGFRVTTERRSGLHRGEFSVADHRRMEWLLD
ncbi:GNAT family N-acetyltransferase [Dyella solisilvae]|uniref:GNAT family N-acetyltransferase n=1 Tax=Dyella solisilvae TaxID=1920168 RepID=A0A370K9A8_9GAMM|nr:GNAT family N-acetyltransferase [Dyella solisilvae]RDI98620.1 GNAT family N-acetyltransferase [Dyella solisilvae]